jgi:phage gp45-like
MYDELDDSVTGQLVRVTLTGVDDSGPQQLVSCTGIGGQKIGEAVRLQHFGVTGNPPIGAEGLMLISGGRHDRPHILGLEDAASRQINSPSGTKVLYDASGNCIRAYGKDGIQVEAKTGDIFVKPADGKNVYHGGNGKDGAYAPVMTAQGPSSNVFAKVG